MNIIVRTTLMQDKITELLDGGVFDGVVFSFIEKKGMALTFHASGDNLEMVDVEAIVKKAIKSTEYGKGIYFSVNQE
ncbi:MAG: hypothetical protein FWH57_04945 [Oscillospiraceae bacterium]|nr:hypothetical protein [Oscillospiraceae bacterium]